MFKAKAYSEQDGNRSSKIVCDSNAERSKIVMNL
jgi:hypothetical protein